MVYIRFAPLPRARAGRQAVTSNDVGSMEMTPKLYFRGLLRVPRHQIPTCFASHIEHLIKHDLANRGRLAHSRLTMMPNRGIRNIAGCTSTSVVTLEGLRVAAPVGGDSQPWVSESLAQSCHKLFWHIGRLGLLDAVFYQLPERPRKKIHFPAPKHDTASIEPTWQRLAGR